MLARPVPRRIATSAFGRHLQALVNARPYTSEHTASHDIGILGGGVTGLACAYYLTQELPTAKVTLYEAKDSFGGWLQSTRVPVKGGSIVFEAGPRTLRLAGNGVVTAKLMQELDLVKDAIFTSRQAPAARNRYLYYPDHIVRLPHPSHGIFTNIQSLLTEPAFATAVKSILFEPFKDARDPGIQDESVGHFFSRRFGSTVVDRMLSAVIHGIYAGDVYKLSAKSLFPNPWRGEGSEGSVMMGIFRPGGPPMTKREAEFTKEMIELTNDRKLNAVLKDSSVFTFKDGIGALSDKLYEHLYNTGRVEFKPSAPVTAIQPSEGNTGVQVTIGSSGKRKHSHVVSTFSPQHLNAATQQSLGSQLIGTVPTVTVMSVSLYFRSPDLHPPGFGYLIPRATPFENNPERALGVIFDNCYSPGPEVSARYEQAVEAGEIDSANTDKPVQIGDFEYYNISERPVVQDTVREQRGTKLTVMLGGHWWDGWPEFPDEKEGLAMALSLLKRHLNITEQPEAWQVNLNRDCIPQYTVGHEQRLKQAHNTIWREYKGRLRVAGNWMSGVGVNDCMRSARDLARNFSRDATGLEHVGEVPSVRFTPAEMAALRQGQRPPEKDERDQ